MREPAVLSMKSAIFSLLALLSLTTAQAEQFGLFTYEVTDGEITITDYPEDATGHVEIPAEVEGLPVTTIGHYAFGLCNGLTEISIPDTVTRIGSAAFYCCSKLSRISIPEGVVELDYEAFALCSSLTEITIPDGVISIGFGAFRGCVSLAAVTLPATLTELQGGTFEGTALTSVAIPAGITEISRHAFSGCRKLAAIHVEPGGMHYASTDGVVFNAEMTELIDCPEGKAGRYAIPTGVSDIGRGAFEGCSSLTRIAIPNSTTSIGYSAFANCSSLGTVIVGANVNTIYGRPPFSGIRPTFYGCTSLATVIFLGDAPRLQTSGGDAVFADAAPDFTIYHLSTSTGFTAPTWHGYPTVKLDEVTYPAAPWLVSHGLPQDTDLNQDLNGDGISLLMACALDLNPNTNLQSQLPTPVRTDDALTLTFRATARGITYTVETSTDLRNWTEEGVLYSEIGEDRQRTASIAINGPQRFLRLVLAPNP